MLPEKKSPVFSLDPLYPSFVAAKPIQTVSDTVVLALEQEGHLIKTRKRDGFRTYAVHLETGVRLYTRGIEDITDKFPAVVAELKKLQLPHNTLTDGELLYKENGRDDLGAISRIVMSAPEKALRIQEEHGSARHMMFNVMIYDGFEYFTKSHGARLAMVGSFFSGRSLENVFPIEVLDVSLADAEELVRRRRWEGLVLYDARASTAFALDGKRGDPPRPTGCWKRKPYIEDDFFAREFVYGTKGKQHEKRMGKLNLLQIDPVTGAEVSCGAVGVGFSVSEREMYARTMYPGVVEVKFDERNPSGALRNPRFLRPRLDKKWNECVLPSGFRPKTKK